MHRNHVAVLEKFPHTHTHFSKKWWEGWGVAIIQSRPPGLSNGRVRSKEPLVCEENVGKHKHTPHTAAPLHGSQQQHAMLP